MTAEQCGIRQPAILNSLKTHCQNGHPFEGDNLRIHIRRGRPQRECITCARTKDRDAYRRRLFAAHVGGIAPAYVERHDMPVDVWKRIELAQETGCWLWTGSTNRQGYGRTRHGGKTKYTLTHRLTYELVVGLIPSGLELDHLCRVRNCCNPEHLEPVTHRENMLRARRAALAS